MQKNCAAAICCKNEDYVKRKFMKNRNFKFLNSANVNRKMPNKE